LIISHAYTLFVFIFSRFHVREFAWDDQLVEKQRQELEEAGTSEKELWVSDLVRLKEPLILLKKNRTFEYPADRHSLPFFVRSSRPNSYVSLAQVSPKPIKA